jgi:hypothetical protein
MPNDHLDDAGAVFTFRAGRPLDYDHRDTPRQKAQLCAAMRPTTLGSRTLARINARTIVPRTRWGVRALIGTARTLSFLPPGITRSVARLNTKGIRLYDSMPLPDYPAPAIR